MNITYLLKQSYNGEKDEGTFESDQPYKQAENKMKAIGTISGHKYD